MLSSKKYKHKYTYTSICACVYVPGMGVTGKPKR